MLGIQKLRLWFGKLLSKLDFYNSNFTFRWNAKKEGFGSPWGGILTIGSGIVFIFLISSSINDVIFRENPNFIYEQERPNNRPYTNLSTDNFTILFNFQFANSSSVKMDNELMYIYTGYRYAVKNESTSVWTGPFIRHLTKPCSQDKLKQAKVDLGYCFDDGVDVKRFGGYGDEVNKGYFYVSFQPCVIDSIVNVSKCKSKEEIIYQWRNTSLNEKFSYYAYIFFSDWRINLRNFGDYASPKIASKYLRFDITTKQTMYVYLKPVDINIDSGWFTSDNSFYRFYVYDYTETIVQVSDWANGDFGTVSFIFYVSDNKDNYYLTYMKVMDAISNIGGTMQIVLFFLAICAPLYTNKQKYEETLNEIFNFYYNSKNNLISRRASMKRKNSSKLNNDSSINFQNQLGEEISYKISQNNEMNIQLESVRKEINPNSHFNNESNQKNQNNSFSGMIEDHKIASRLINNLNENLENEKLDKEDKKNNLEKLQNSEIKQIISIAKNNENKVQTTLHRKKSSLERVNEKDTPIIIKKSKEKIEKLKDSSKYKSIFVNEKQYEEFLGSYFERKYQKEGKINFTWQAWAKSMCPGMNVKEVQEINLLYKKGVDYINKILNYISYIKLYYDFEKLKMIVLTKDELALFNFTSKPIISLTSDISKITQVLEDNGDEYKVLYDIYKYFEKLSQNTSRVTKTEKKLISFLDYDLQVQLGEKFNCSNIFDQCENESII